MEEIHYKTTAPDFEAGFRYWFLHKSLRWILLAYAITFVVCLVITKGQAVMFSIGLIAVVTSGTMLYYWLIQFPLYARKSIGVLPAGYTGTTVRFGQGKLELESAMGKGSLNWLLDVVITGKHVLLFVGARAFTPIPCSAFENSAQLERFLSVARDLVGAGNAPAESEPKGPQS